MSKAPTWLYRIRHRKKRGFLAAFAEAGTVLGASEAAGVDRQSHYNWLKDDIDYVEAFAIAKELSIDKLEKTARKRAIDGVEEIVYQGGKEVGKQIKYSDTLLMFLLNGEKPQKYKQRHEMSGPNNGPIVTVGIDLSLVSTEDIAKELQNLELLAASITGKTIPAPEGTKD